MFDRGRSSRTLGLVPGEPGLFLAAPMREWRRQGSRKALRCSAPTGSRLISAGWIYFVQFSVLDESREFSPRRSDVFVHVLHRGVVSFLRRTISFLRTFSANRCLIHLLTTFVPKEGADWAFVRFGSKGDMPRCLPRVCFAPDFDRKSRQSPSGRMLLSSVTEEYDHAR